MDKYEFNIKVEQIRKLVNKGDYGTAMKIADGIDWKKVRNANLLSMVAQVYEKNEEYQDAKDILLLAFERAPIGKRLLYKLTELSLKEGNVEEAEGYYREFCDLAGDDPRQQLLRYQILKQKNAPLAQLINSLESYTSEELDEKWLYELAELYHEAGDADRCVAACDKIMLMFGLGKYVDKAMDLKIQYSPLSTYQMDLVENRDKYEAKLRAVEQTYQGSGRGRGADRDPVVKVQRSSPDAAPVAAARPLSAAPAGTAPVSRPQVSGASPDPGDYAEGQEEMEYDGYGEMEEPVTGPEESQFQEEYASGDEYEGEAEEDYGTALEDSYEAPAAYAAVQEDVYGRPEVQEPPQPGPAAPMAYAPVQPAESSVSTAYGQGGLDTVVKQAETEATLAREMSRMAEQSGAELNEAADDLGKTRILPEIRRTSRENPEPGIQQASRIRSAPGTPYVQQEYAESGVQQAQAESVRPSVAPAQETAPAPAGEPGPRNIGDYVLIEARMPERGLAMATAVLKQIRKETGIKNPVAKTTGAKLNRIGIQASAKKLAGKDLIIEKTGDLEPGRVEELQNLMAQNQYGMRVILLDNPRQIQMFCGKYPAFAAYFDYISSEDYQSGDDPMESPGVSEANPSVSAESSRSPERARSGEPSTGAGNIPSGQPSRSSEAAPPAESPHRPVSGRTVGPARPGVAVHSVEPSYSATASRPSAESSRTQGGAYQRPEEYADATQPAVPEEDDRPVRHIIPVRDSAMRAPDPVSYEEPLPEEPLPDEEEMDIDEFAQYACKYASDIDCSITGKSMLALYERIEIMEEDGIPLTRENAEALIEEAADRAEKPSLGRRIRNLFSSKYDKQGMLILKEEHFI